MKRLDALAIGILVAVSLFALLSPTAASAQVLFPSRGGTGTSAIPIFGQVLVGNANGTYTLTATSSLGITGGGGGSGITTLNGLTSDPQVFASSTSNGGWGFSSSASTHTLNIPTASATNPLGLLSSTDWTAFNAKEAVLSFVYPLVRSANSISLAFGTTTSNTWAGTQTFTNLVTGSITGNAGTATALATNGANCSTGNAALGVDASGASESCFDVWTEAENTAASYVPQSRQLTLAGTANQITASAGAQTLAADRTWTFSLPSHVIFPGSFQASSGSTTNATSTNHAVTSLLTFGGVTGNSWDDFCVSITGSSALCDGSDDGAGGGAGTVTQINTTYPVQGGPITTTGTLSLAFGTTTANTWSSLQTFTSGINVNSETFTDLTGTNLTNTAGVLGLSATYTGQSSITTLGTIGTGVWQGTAIADAYLTKTGDWTGTLDGQEGSYYLANSFSTTSANYWETQQTARTADDLTNNSIEDLSDVAAITENFGDLLAWNGSAWADLATSSLGINFSDLIGSATDGQVTDALTISGGTIENTPIGAATPSTAIFTNATATNATTTNFYASGQTRLASLSGLLKATSGVVSAATAGVDYLASAVTAIGPAGQTADGPTVTFATSTSAFNGLTPTLVITGSGDTLTYTSSLTGTLGNAGLTNSTVSFGGVSLALGGTDATPAFDLTDATNLPIVGGTSGTLTVARGGTGQATFTSSQLLYGNGTNALSSVATTSASCAGSVSCTGFTVIGASPITITGTDTSGITAIGPTGQTSDGPTTTFATSTDTNVGLTITGSGDTLTFTSTWAGTLADARVADTLTIGSGSTVADGALSANVSLLGTTIGATELASADFGSFTCNGTTCTVDAGAISNAMLANSTISGIALGANLADLTATDSSLTFSGTYNGSTARTVGLNVGNANVWTAHQRFTNASSTLFSNVGTAYFGGTATTTINSAGSVALPIGATLTVTDMTSALLQTNGSGVVAEYAGTSCTNQVTTALSALGIATCSSINNAYWSGTDLSVANGGTGLSTFGGTNHVLYTTAADTLASEAAFTYDPSVNRITLDYASTTAISGTNFNFSGIGIMARAIISGIAAAFTPSVEGEIGIDTTTNQFKYFSGGAVRVLGDGNFYPAFTYSTTTAWTGTTTIALGPAYTGETWNGVKCFTDTGTVNVSFYDGTNRMNMLNASTTVGTFTLSTNNAFTASEKRYVDIGTPATTPTKISCTVSKSLVAD